MLHECVEKRGENSELVSERHSCLFKTNKHQAAAHETRSRSSAMDNVVGLGSSVE